MTPENEPVRAGNFVTIRLPWLLAAGMLAVYLITLVHGVSPGNLQQLVELSGWNWHPNVFAPLTLLVTYPLRWLPAGETALAANLFAALCAALTLALLARSVTLLPERSRFSSLANQGAWLPPVLAVLACGLQLTFLENSIQAGGEMPDLLVFAYTGRCLLEFRVDRKMSWLTRFAFIYGLELANNWAMVGYLPLFVAALFWTRPLHFKLSLKKKAGREGAETVASALAADFRLFTRLALSGLAGFSLILLPPLIASLAHARHLDFGPGLHLVLAAYKHMLVEFPKDVVLLLSITSVLPVLFMGIYRWGYFFRNPTPSLSEHLSRIALHLIHGAFLIAGIWVALDCPFSPRQQGLGFAFLPFYYLGALSIGYFSGYFLIVFGTRTPTARRSQPVTKGINMLVTAGIGLLLAAVPSLLLYLNLPRIRSMHADPWEGYFTLAEKSLPAQGTVILCDDPFELYTFQAALARDGKFPRHLLIETTALGDSSYLQFLDQKYPQFQLAGAINKRFSECGNLLVRIKMLETLRQRHDLYYLHPSFGYYLEAFYPQMHGLVYQLRPYGTNISKAPAPTRDQMAENQVFWQGAMSDQIPRTLRALQPAEPPAHPNVIDRFLRLAHLESEPDRRAQLVGASYARALDYWGVEMQTCGEYVAAAKYFSQAVDLNPDNAAARVNLGFNQNRQAGKPPVMQPAKASIDKSGNRREWYQVLQEDGPFAEPNFCYQIGVAFAKNGLYRQAIQQFDRVQALAPDLTDAHFWLARLFIHTENYSNALAAADQILEARPDDNNALFLKAVSLLQSKNYDDAIAPFTHLLALQGNNYAAQLNRAIAYLQLGNLDAARRDYEEVAKAIPQTYQAWFGLAEIAYRQKDSPAAIKNYESYLKYAPRETEEARLAGSRLNELKGNQR